MTKIYTRAGDRGETGLIGGARVPKDHPRVQAYGAIDELNSHLGVVIAALDDADTAGLLRSIQHRLFDLGAELATPASETAESGMSLDQVEALEHAIDGAEQTLTPLREFILPGGSHAAAALHVARAVARRAERHVVTLARSEPVNPQIVPYLNRLSDLFFVLARAANRRAGRPDIAWKKSP
ncbi:MAG TPA: cob(I)yrinic acid a,c-diamide adenosyltransferase [bacterium]|nr:cob(I)yrinic acid a,c-diamide adenosyltransferase [bacterium]